MLKEISSLSTQYKDFFWVVFTLAATISSALTCMYARKELRKSLVDTVTEHQVNLYTEILELLGSAEADFIGKCDLDNFIRLNFLGHLMDKGFLADIPEIQYVHTWFQAWMNQEEENDLVQLEQSLNWMKQFSIEFTEDVLIQDEKSGTSAGIKDGNMDIKPTQKLVLLDARGLMLHTPLLNDTYRKILECNSNIYMPTKLQKSMKKLQEELERMMLENATSIIRREENVIFHGKAGQVVEIDFDHLYNELMESSDALAKEYRNVKKQIRKLLRIDAR